MPLPIIKNPGDLSDILKDRRKALGVTQGDVASLHDLSRFTVGDVESGRGDPKFSTITTILEGLGLSLLVVPTSVAERITIPEPPLEEALEDEFDPDEIDFGGPA